MANLNSWQRIDRVFKGKVWGDGADGSATISSDPNTRATITGTATQTTGTAGSTSFANGDLVMLHQTQGTGAGQWEINKIASGGGSTSLTFSKALQYTYGTGAQIIKIPRYTTATVSGYSVQAWDGTVGGITVICAKESVTVSGTINGSGKGFRGGTGNLNNSTNATGQCGEGIVGPRIDSQSSANGNGGGGGYNSSKKLGGGGGGHSGYGIQGGGSGGSGGNPVGSSDLISINLGGGGGQGCYWTSDGVIKTYAGNGGGIIILISKLIVLNVVSNSDGTNGTNSGPGFAASGGGSGGSFLMICETGNFGSNLLVSNKGIGGNVGSEGKYSTYGGDGSPGRIAVHYSDSVSGTTSPTYTEINDPSLKESGGGNFIPFFMT